MSDDCQTCRACRGSGKIETDTRYVTCAGCEGRGYIPLNTKQTPPLDIAELRGMYAGTTRRLNSIWDKCEQYWNSHNIADEEIHAALEFIRGEIGGITEHKHVPTLLDRVEALTGELVAWKDRADTFQGLMEDARTERDTLRASLTAVQDAATFYKLHPTNQNLMAIMNAIPDKETDDAEE